MMNVMQFLKATASHFLMTIHKQHKFLKSVKISSYTANLVNKFSICFVCAIIARLKALSITNLKSFDD